ncbi:MAG: hypothetical protein ACJ76P_06615 [Actinomycetota bacterium]
MSDTEPGRSSYQAVAKLPSVDAARRAADELRRAGFEGEGISVSDESMAELSEPERRERDEAIGQRTRGATWGWAAAGAVAGAVIGSVGTILFTDGGITAIATVGVAAAILVGIVAGLVAGYGSLRDDRPSRAPVVADGETRSIVGVSVATRAEADRAVRTLRDSGASAVEVFDEAGNPLDGAV